MSNKKILKYLAVTILGLLIIYCLYHLEQYVYQHLYENKTNQERIILIPQGIGIQSISRVLLKADLIEDDIVFCVAAKIRSFLDEKYLIAGEYNIAKGMSMDEIIDKIMSGDIVVRKLTLPEGILTKDVIQTIIKSDKIFNDLGAAYDNMKDQAIILPETYLYNYNESARKIIERAKNDLRNFLEIEMKNRNHDIDTLIRSETDVLTLASIVEREAKIDEEKPRIAAVYLNRLRIGMPLQADPSVIFAITQGQSFDRKLTYDDLKFNSPYNTYTNKGLPPGPICNPGKQSIKAVLNPLKTNEIYFVANGNGGHYFATSFKEHKQNIKKYREAQ